MEIRLCCSDLHNEGLLGLAIALMVEGAVTTIRVEHLFYLTYIGPAAYKATCVLMLRGRASFQEWLLHYAVSLTV